MYTVGCLSIPVVTITSTARRAFVWATRHEIGGENRSRDAECETREHGCFQAKCLLYAFIAGLYASRGITEERGIAGECMQIFHRYSISHPQMNLRDRVREIFLIFPVLSTLILIAEDYLTYLHEQR